MTDIEVVELVGDILIGKSGFGETSNFENIKTLNGFTLSKLLEKFTWCDFLEDYIESYSSSFELPKGIYEAFNEPIWENTGRETEQEIIIEWNGKVYRICGYEEAHVRELSQKEQFKLNEKMKDDILKMRKGQERLSCNLLMNA